MLCGLPSFSKMWDLVPKMSQNGRSLYFSDLVKVDAKLKNNLPTYFSNASMFTNTRSISAAGTIQQKHEGALKKCSVLLQGSYCPSLQQRVMGAINQQCL